MRLVGLEPTRYISTNGLTKAQAPMETRNDALVKSVAPTYYATSARAAQLGFEPRTYRLWSGIQDSNLHHQLGRLKCRHYTNTAQPIALPLSYWATKRESKVLS